MSFHPSARENGAGLSPGPGMVVVTGAAGFIGSHLVDRLLSLGHQVVGVDCRDPRSDELAAFNLAGASACPRFALVEADLVHADLESVVAGAEVVYHLAAVPGVRPSWGSRFVGYVASNVVGTQRLLAACERAGVRRLVYASSSSVYGAVASVGRECDPTRPMSPYGVTKLAGEQLCLAHALRPDTTLTVVALRYFTVYGPRQRPDMAIGRILTGALTGVRYTLFGDGSQRRDFTYVDDVIDATLAAADSSVPTTVVNVGGGAPVSLIEVIDVAREVTGHPVPLTAVPPRPGDVSATAADLSLAAALLGFQPRVDLPAGMRRQAQWLRQLPAGLLPRFAPPPVAVEEVAACSS